MPAERMMLAFTCTLAVAAAGCMRRAEPRLAPAPLPVTAAFVVDLEGGTSVAAPESFVTPLLAELSRRNLPAEALGVDRWAFGGARATPQRMDRLLAGTDTPLILLVEARGEPTSQIEGKWGWSVAVRMTLHARGQTSGHQAALEAPVYLSYPSGGVDAALRAAAIPVARRLGQLADEYLDGVSERAAPPRDGAATAARIDGYYLAMIDRFANGDRSNDGLVDTSDAHAFHGGDLAGLTAHAEHIASLGLRQLWITPPWKTRETRIGPYGAFHGYWTEDPRTIDPRFGDDADVAALIGRLRADGMGLVIDFVGNHVAPGSPLLAEHPDWFHRNGDIVNWADPIEAVTHDVHGLPDLAQENRDVARYLIDAALHGDGFVPQGGGAALRPAGLRLDAVRHVPSDFFRALSSSMRAVDPEVVLIGELFDGSPSAVAETWRDGGFTAMFDFPMHFALVDVFCKGAHPGRIGAVLSQDRLYPDATKLAPFLDNHDTQRIASACSGDLDRVREAIAALYAMRGAPVITWGTEAGLLGAGEPENRADMPWGEEFPLLRDLQAAAALRASHPALSAPSPRVLALTDSLIAWSARSDRDHAVVAIHRGPGLVHLPLPDGGGWTALRGSIDGDSLVVGTGVAIARRWSIHVALDAPETVELQVTAAGAPSGELRLVGAGPELGDWRPKHGLSMPTTLRVRPGDVLQMKLVVVNVDGAASWEARSDRFVLVGDADQDLDLVWGA